MALIIPLTVQGAEAARVTVADGVETYVNIRAEPSTDSDVIGALHPGKSARLISEQKEWFAIELSGGVTGYVRRNLTRKTTVNEPKPRNRPVYAADDSDTPVQSMSEAAADRTVLAQADTLLKQGRAQAAYGMLSEREKQWGGDSGFDYLYGVAALDSGHAGEAIFALDRVTTLMPGFVGARMELARALYQAGDHERAEQEFEELLDNQPPEEARTVIMSYLKAIRGPAAGQGRSDKLFYAMASGGYDSNANGAADINEFMSFALSPRSTEQESSFVQARLGGIVRRPLGRKVDFVLQGDARHRHNPDADFVDNSFASTTVGLVFGRDQSELNLGVAAYWSALDSEFNERSVALDLGWSQTLEKNAMQFTMRAGPVKFSDNQKARNVDRVLYTFTMRRPSQSGGEFNWTLIGGRDLADDRQAYSNSRFGGRLGARWKVARSDVTFGIGLLSIPYDGNSNFFGIDRKDDQFTSTLAVEIPDKPFRGWTFVPNARYVKNDSNVPIYNYDRVEIGLIFRVAR